MGNSRRVNDLLIFWWLDWAMTGRSKRFWHLRWHVPGLPFLPVPLVLSALFAALWTGTAGTHAAAQETPDTAMDSLVESFVILGENYEAGDWVQQSDLLAYMWYLLATTAGYGPADTARHRLSQRLTAAERAAAQALARQCHNTGYRECGEATQAEDLASLSEGEDDG